MLGLRSARGARVVHVRAKHYLIVGAGSAGCTLAHRLAEDAENSVPLWLRGSETMLESNFTSATKFLRRTKAPGAT